MLYGEGGTSKLSFPQILIIMEIIFQVLIIDSSNTEAPSLLSSLS